MGGNIKELLPPNHAGTNIFTENFYQTLRNNNSALLCCQVCSEKTS